MRWLAPILMLLQLRPMPVADAEAAQAIKDGNRLYKAGQWAAAANEYEKAINTPYHTIALLNKGNTLYRQKKNEDAIKSYHQSAAPLNGDTRLRAVAYYNAGVVYSHEKKIAQSIEEYKKSLRLNWKDTQARENLQKALLELQKQQGGGGDKQKQAQQEQQIKSRLNQMQAQQQLDRLEEKEKNTQQKVSAQKGQLGGSTGKDW